jgi:hypothetical protein
MLDWMLDATVWVLPFLLSVVGIYVSIEMPKSHHKKAWLASLLILGVLTSALALWQQARSRTAHESEVTALNERIKALGEDLRVINVQAETLGRSHLEEVARRQQAEKDLQLYIAGIGRITRAGVAADIRSSPIQVHVNGQPTRNPDEVRKVREALGRYLLQGVGLRDRCQSDPEGSTLEQEASAWYGEVTDYLQKNLDSSFVSQFVMTKLRTFNPNGVAEKRLPLWAGLDQRVETLSRFIDQLKQP